MRGGGLPLYDIVMKHLLTYSITIFQNTYSLYNEQNLNIIFFFALCTLMAAENGRATKCTLLLRRETWTESNWFLPYYIFKGHSPKLERNFGRWFDIRLKLFHELFNYFGQEIISLKWKFRYKTFLIQSFHTGLTNCYSSNFYICHE